MKKKLWIVLWLALMLALLAACGESENKGAESPQNPHEDVLEIPIAAPNEQNEPTAPADLSTVYPITVIDASGVEVTFDKAPERIVSISSSETEILFALGLGDKIVGVSDYDNYPEEALDKPKMGGVINPNEELIVASNADLVVSGMSLPEDIAERLRSLGIKLYRPAPKSVDEVLETILQFGEITDTQGKAEEIVASMREDLRKVTEAVAAIPEEDRLKVFIEFAPGWTVGGGEFLDELVTLAGGVNIASDIPGWSQINEEKVIADNPEVILYAADLIDYDTGKTLEELIMERKAWSSITAIQEKRLVPLNQDIIARTGPRLTQGLLLIFEGLYPDLNP